MVGEDANQGQKDFLFIDNQCNNSFNKISIANILDKLFFAKYICLKLITMKNTIGHPAQGDNFFPRPKEVAKILKRIDAGGHIQLTAPRRVGKTSILMHLRDNPTEGYHFVYIDTEGINDADQYFKRIYQEILRSDFISRSAKIKVQLQEKGNRFLDRLKGFKIMNSGIDLNEADEIDHFDQLLNFVKGIDLDGKKIILLNDEFPYTIENIIDKNDGNISAAVDFLKQKREMRIDPDFREKLQFIYTGSIGLNALVERMGKTELVNDIPAVSVDPLNETEAKQLIAEVLNTYNYTMTDDTANYLLAKIEWLIPFHLQLALGEIMDMQPEGELSNNKVIDDAFVKIVDYKNNNYFDNYYTRLRKHFKKEEFEFAEELLSDMASDKIKERNQINNLAVKYNVQDSLKSILGTLQYDGYINNNGDTNVYRYNSPIIKMWWQKYVCK